ncbi:MAG: PEGA domain-containing protein [Candidatus Atribacteria bacterium]|nr:PEGA domain-containing protein [Candidatus Atribacteria bacterium]
MSKNVFFLKRSKMLVCVFTTLLIFLCLVIIGISYAQSVEETEKMKSIQIINPHPEFSLRLWLDKERGVTYAPGERIKIFFQVSRDSFVTLYSYDTGGRGKIIFPNPYSPHNLVKAGEVNTFEGQIDPSTQPGIEYVLGFATTRPIPTGLIPELNKDYKAFTHQLKGIIQPLPPTDWVQGNLLSYVITPIIPPQSYGSISVNSNPKGAEIYLDDVYEGLTPLKLDNINLGQHGIKIVMSGYQEWASYISILPSQTTKVFADLMPQQSYGSISVNSNPKGAKIYLDNVYKGLTPLKLGNINSGERDIKIVMSGYQEWTSYISILPSQTTKVFADLMPQQSYGSISVNSNPKGAKVYLDNAYKGLTPLKLDKINSGQRGIKIVMSGYQEWTSYISILPSQTTKVSADLMSQQSYGSISVSCDQSGAKIFLDGTYKKTTSTNPVILENVEDGYHELTVIKDSFRTWVEDIVVYFGEESSVDVTMTELF